MTAKIAFVFTLAAASIAAGATPPDATQLLKTAETIRNPRVSYTAVTTLTDVRTGKEAETRTYAISVKVGNKTLVSYLTPETDRGTKVLMVEEDMYISLPTSAKPIKVAPRQKLVGNAAYGDIARLNYDDNYDATYIGEQDFEGKKAHVLDLKPKPDHPVTYDRIEYWVDKDTGRPVQAFYKTTLGKTLRSALFTNWQDVLGVKRPLTMVLTDELNKGLKTTIELSKMKPADLPDTLFQRGNLR